MDIEHTYYTYNILTLQRGSFFVVMKQYWCWAYVRICAITFTSWFYQTHKTVHKKLYSKCILCSFKLMEVVHSHVRQEVQCLYFLFFCLFLFVFYLFAIVCLLISQMLQPEEALDRLPSTVQSFLNTYLQPSNNNTGYVIRPWLWRPGHRKLTAHRG